MAHISNVDTVSGLLDSLAVVTRGTSRELISITRVGTELELPRFSDPTVNSKAVGVVYL